MDFLPFTRPSIDEETIAGVAEVLRSGWITSGPRVREFEAELSRCCAGRPVRSLNSGTAALEIGLRLAGVGPGDEVKVRVWGKVEGAWSLTIERDGTVRMPKVGVVALGGMTFEQAEAHFLGYISMRTWIDPTEIGDTAVFLASHAGRHISGQNLGVCGNIEWES